MPAKPTSPAGPDVWLRHRRDGAVHAPHCRPRTRHEQEDLRPQVMKQCL